MPLRSFSDFTAFESLDAATLDERALVFEALSAGFAKGAAVAILAKLNQQRQRINQGRTARPSDKALADMIFWLSALVGTLIGTLQSDQDLVSRAKRLS